jgi:UDP-N-acetyl-D-glucosamine dehydrogenase
MPQQNLITLQTWLDRVAARETHIAIIGLGYVGLPLALLFADAGFKVTGFDIDSAKVDNLNAGRSYIHRIEAAQIIASRANGFHATTRIADLNAADAILICVPTPLANPVTGSPSSSHEPDMSFITSTVEALAPHIRPAQLIVLESTTWPGTTSEVVLPILERLGNTPISSAKNGLGTRYPLIKTCFLAFSPEREDPGNPSPRSSIPKVIGGISPDATTLAGTDVFNRSSRNDQASRKYLPKRQYRLGQ